MKVGDLVTYNSDQEWVEGDKFIGLVIETGTYVGNRDVKIMWCHDGDVSTSASSRLEVISESR